MFAESEIKPVAKICNHVFQVRIRGADFCFTLLGTRLFLRELGKLQMIPCHPNVVRLAGAVDAENEKIDGTVTSFISGYSLGKVKSVTNIQKDGWKEEISNTAYFLHEIGVV